MQSVLSEIRAEGSVAVLTISNGAKNLITEPEFISREALLSWLDAHPEVRALVITGKGRHFSHGADTTLFDITNVDAITDKLERGKALLDTIERLPLVTIAAVNGGCFGGGLEIALACQFRIASPKAFLGLTEIMHGVVPGMGGMDRLYRLLGREKALQMILQGEMLPAEEALSIGLVTKISAEKDALGDAMAFAHTLTDGRTAAQIRAVTQTVQMAADGVQNPSKGMFETALAEANA